MSRRYNSVKEMVKAMMVENCLHNCLGFKFYENYCEQLHPKQKEMQNLQHLKIYQSRRVYLDEYPEQKELRKSYFNHKALMNRCIQMLANAVYGVGVSVKDFENTFNNKPDYHFVNRWLNRN